MADWIGSGYSTAEIYQGMAEHQLRDVSPSYAAICLGVAADRDVLARLETLPPPKRQPNLLLGGSVASWPAFRGFVLDHWDELAAVMSTRRTQTNEPGRCATLLPVLAALPQPLALFEVGASAGLCLYPDRYSYEYVRDGLVERRVEVGSGAPRLRCAVTGPAPLPHRPPEVVWRGGLDLHPLDVRDDEDVRWLEALVWPEQRDRFATLRAAVATVRLDPPRIVAGDLRRDVVAAVADAPRDATVVIFHSAVLAYVPEDQRADFYAQVTEVRAGRTVCWISNEGPGVVTPAGASAASGGARFVLARDGVPLALASPHGQTLEWW